MPPDPPWSPLDADPAARRESIGARLFGKPEERTEPEDRVDSPSWARDGLEAARAKRRRVVQVEREEP